MPQPHPHAIVTRFQQARQRQPRVLWAVIRDHEDVDRLFVHGRDRQKRVLPAYEPAFAGVHDRIKRDPPPAVQNGGGPGTGLSDVHGTSAWTTYTTCRILRRYLLIVAPVSSQTLFSQVVALEPLSRMP